MRGQVKQNELTDGGGTVIKKYMSLSAKNERVSAGVILTAEKNSSIMENAGEAVDNTGGVIINYNSFINKAVPKGYQLSAEETAARDRGDIVFPMEPIRRHPQK